MLHGLMMDRPLLVSSVIDYAAEVYPDVEIVSQTAEDGLQRQGYRAARERIGRLANALKDLDIKPGDRVATLTFNGFRHFELYYAVAGIGAVCHAINPRLFHEQIAYIANHAEDKALFVDPAFLPLVETLAPSLKSIRNYVLLTDRAHMPPPALRARPAGSRRGLRPAPIRGAGRSNGHLDSLLCYEEVLAQSPPGIDWPDLDENAACALCYTSGTTGEPKGVLFSNRSIVLGALRLIATRPDLFALNRRLLLAVPMFHANGWGLPYTAPVTGCALILPGSQLDGRSLFNLMQRERADVAFGVPTVWLGLVDEMQKRGRKPKHFKEIVSGGSAVPQPLIDRLMRDWRIDVAQGWGMTEVCPAGTITVLRPEERSKPLLKRIKLAATQGRRMFGTDPKVVDASGKRVPAGGSGDLLVRGPTVASGYFKNRKASADRIDSDGWFATGDVAKITPDGWLMIVDRTKDLVKSGGEWISSIDLENAALACKGIANCAVIGVPHPKWNERPLLVVVKAPGAEPSKAEILEVLASKVARWQLPDDVAFVDALPLTATGKISKKDLRAQFADYQLPE